MSGKSEFDASVWGQNAREAAVITGVLSFQRKPNFWPARMEVVAAAGGDNNYDLRPNVLSMTFPALFFKFRQR